MTGGSGAIPHRLGKKGICVGLGPIIIIACSLVDDSNAFPSWGAEKDSA